MFGTLKSRDHQAKYEVAKERLEEQKRETDEVREALQDSERLRRVLKGKIKALESEESNAREDQANLDEEVEIERDGLNMFWQ